MFSGNRLWTVGIEDKEGFITRLYLPGRSDAVSEGPETPLLGEAFAQLEAYFSGRRKAFDLPLRFEGTPFMKRVWQALWLRFPMPIRQAIRILPKPSATRRLAVPWAWRTTAIPLRSSSLATGSSAAQARLSATAAGWA